VSRNFYEILGIKPDATANEISKAYRKLVLKFHPDRFSDPIEKKKMEETLKEITEAYNTLSNWNLRQEYNKTLETRSVEKLQRKNQEICFLRLLNITKMVNLKSAESLFSYLSRLTPNDISVKFYLGMCKLYSPLSRMEGAKLVEEALKKDPFHPLWFIEYASFLRKVGQNIRARKVIEEGMKLNPNDFNLPEFFKEDNNEIKKGSPLGGLFGKKS